jgi:DNA primase
MSQALAAQITRKLAVPAYVKQYINHEIDLDSTPKICCLFHDETTPSFSYNKDKGVWRCFGACKVGGDVIAMHMKHHKIKSRDEAMKNLASLLGIDSRVLDLSPPEIKLDENLIQYGPLLNRATKVAKTVDDYLDLDYIMSQHKPTHELKEDLELYINRRSSN